MAMRKVGSGWLRSFAILLITGLAAGVATAQPPGTGPPPPPGGPPDFNAAVKPILQTRCVSCHGANLQQGGLRLDDRAAALRGGTNGPVIVPGHSETSRLFAMVASKRMPLDDELSILELGTLKAWIDGGAPWPEPRAIPAFSVDPRVDTWRLALRNLDRAGAAQLLQQADFAKARAKDGSTALHQAVLYGGVADVRALLDKGADPNAVNFDGITPLIWGVRDDAIARLLVERGADVNAVSEAGVTPLIAAAGTGSGTNLVRLLVNKGAKATPAQAPALATSAGASASVEMLRVLMPKVLDPAGPAGEIVAADAARTECYACLDYAISQGVRGPQLAIALVVAANSGDAALVKRLLGLGATLDGRAQQGATALIAAAASERQAVEKVRLLLEAGADPNVPAPDGRTALRYATTRHPELIPLLTAKGAK